MKAQGKTVIRRKPGPSPSGKAKKVRPIRFDDELVARVDAWRKKQSGKPDFSTAVRQLIKRGLEPKVTIE
jgi:hypothetical protein